MRARAVASLCARIAALIDALPSGKSHKRGATGDRAERRRTMLLSLARLVEQALRVSHHSRYSVRSDISLTAPPLLVLRSAALLLGELQHSSELFVVLDTLQPALQCWLEAPTPRRSDTLLSSAHSSHNHHSNNLSAELSAAVAALWQSATEAVLRCFRSMWDLSMLQRITPLILLGLNSKVQIFIVCFYL